MRIVRVFPSFQTELLYSEHYLAKALKTRYEIDTLFVTSTHIPKHLKPFVRSEISLGFYKFPDFDLLRIPSIYPFEKTIFTNFSEIAKITKDEKIKVIHLYGLATFSTLIWMFIIKLYRYKGNVVISDHSDTHTTKRSGILLKTHDLFFRSALYPFISRVNHFVTPTKEGENVLNKRFLFHEKKWHLIPLGYDSETYYLTHIRNTQKKMIVGFAGKVAPGKKIERLFDAICNTCNSSMIQLIIVGIDFESEYYQQLKNHAQRLNIEVEFRGFATSRELCEFYNYIDLAVYPGGISITTIEASACGTPVLINKSISGLENRVENGRGALFSEDKELVQYLNKYYELYQRNLIMNDVIADYTNKNFSWKKISEIYYQLYLI